MQFYQGSRARAVQSDTSAQPHALLQPKWMRCLRLLHRKKCSKRPQAVGLSDRVSLPRLQRFVLAKI